MPFLKIDKGLADEANGVQLMKPMPTLDELLAKAKSKGIFGTKERSVIKQANAAGIKAVVDAAVRGREAGARRGPRADRRAGSGHQVPGQEGRREDPEEGARRPSSTSCPTDQQVMLKLTMPEVDDLYADLVKHPRVLKVVALSGGYSRDEANARLARSTA